MTLDLLSDICGLVLHAPPLTEVERAQAMLALGDTLAVSLAGWPTPVANLCRGTLNADARPFFDGGEAGAPEHCAFLLAVAAHALDYDDVHLTSVTHPSAVIFPALLAMVQGRPERRAEIFRSYAVGHATNIALGEALGFEHYEAGWHATSTLGTLAAAAALARLLGLGEQETRSAMALAAAQAGGVQRNFGTMAKPIQAGNAAAAAVRAASLAGAGVVADQDIFGPGGFLDLYGTASVNERLPSVRVRYQMGSTSRKLFPCCYASHRLIAAALDARRQLGDHAPPAGSVVVVKVPYGTMHPLRVLDPATGPEGQFCASYIVATALITGGVSLLDFEGDAVRRPSIRDLMTRIDVIEDPPQDPLPVGLDHGSVRLSIASENRRLAVAEIVAFPGSPAAPATQDALNAKLADCLALYNRALGRTMSMASFTACLQGLTTA